MVETNNTIHSNANKDFYDSNLTNIEIALELSKDLEKENIVSEIKYIPALKTLKIVFSKDYDNVELEVKGDVKNWHTYTSKIEEKIKKFPNLTEVQRMSIENTIKKNINLIIDAAEDHLKKIREKNQKEDEDEAKATKKINLKKYVFNKKLYESILLDNAPKFISVNSALQPHSDIKDLDLDAKDHDAPFELHNTINFPGYEFSPPESLNRNPLPYSFESEDEIKKYLEIAKNETFDIIFGRILAQIKDYVNIEEYVQVVLAADILYSYFQEKFGTTHYNIFIGDNGSGKNSILLFFKMLGYRVFYVTSASAANYYTFFGDVQEGQGTIAEDEADDIGYNKDKYKILKTGYGPDGCVPKIELQRNGGRNQASWLTFGHKWLAMEELPDEKEIRGVMDRTFIHKCIVGDVKYNIKNILKDEESPKYKELVHTRKLLFAFKLLHQAKVFPNIKINVTNRNAELTLPLLRMFYGGNSFETIKKALSTILNEKTQLKNNSLESSIVYTLKKLIENHDDTDKDILEITNESFYQAFREITGAIDDFQCHSDSLYFQDGNKTSKQKISRILTSKFKAKPFRTSENRGIQINKKDVEKISKQYEVVDEIIVLNENDKEILEPKTTEQTMTLMTQMTHSEGAMPSINNQEIKPPLNINDDAELKEELMDIDDNKGNSDTTTDSICTNDIADVQDKSEETKISNHQTDNSYSLSA